MPTTLPPVREQKKSVLTVCLPTATPKLFSRSAEELNKFEGNVYTMIVSLRREDAVRLGFDCGQRWRDMLRGHTQELAEALRIPYTNLRWYAAFHNEGHHPHIHLMAYSVNPSEGYLTKKRCMAMRSSLANDIFADELHNEYVEQTTVRDTLKSDWNELIKSIMSALETNTEPHTEIEEKLILLAERLRKTSGKKVYGYLKKDVKDLIDSIVDLIGNDENIAKLYDSLVERKCEILRTIIRIFLRKNLRLSQNKEFKSLKNDIIREAMKIGVAIVKAKQKQIPTPVNPTQGAVINHHPTQGITATVPVFITSARRLSQGCSAVWV